MEVARCGKQLPLCQFGSNHAESPQLLTQILRELFKQCWSNRSRSNGDNGHRQGAQCPYDGWARQRGPIWALNSGPVGRLVPVGLSFVQAGRIFIYPKFSLRLPHLYLAMPSFALVRLVFHVSKIHLQFTFFMIWYYLLLPLTFCNIKAQI